jgi:hypothetical protein
VSLFQDWKRPPWVVSLGSKIGWRGSIDIRVEPRMDESTKRVWGAGCHPGPARVCPSSVIRRNKTLINTECYYNVISALGKRGVD